MKLFRFLLPVALYFAASLSLSAVYLIQSRVEVQGGIRAWYDASKPYHVNSFVFGWESETGSSADYALALGYRAAADGWAAVALGHEVVADDHHAVAIGYQTTAGEDFATAIGFDSTATGIRSFTLGSEGLASAKESMALGFGVTANSYRSVVVGSFNATETSDDTNWDSDDAVFVVGNGENNANRSNAFAILKNGAVGIGLWGEDLWTPANGGNNTEDSLLRVKGKIESTEGGFVLTDGTVLATAGDIASSVDSYFIDDGNGNVSLVSSGALILTPQGDIPMFGVSQ